MKAKVFTHDQITHVSDLFDIVGKTIDNVEYAPSDGFTADHIILYFTDGTAIMIMASEWISEARWHTTTGPSTTAG